MPARQLDRTRPYGEVCGLLGARYEQDGVNFNAAGSEVNPASFARINDEPAPPPVRDDTPIFPAIVMSEDLPKEEPSDWDKKHWKHLKVMVETYGGEWTTKEDAINFLRGKKI